MRKSLLLLVLVFAAEGHAEPIRTFSQETVERLGREIFEQDKVAALAADVLLDGHKAGKVPEATMKAIVGWIVVGTPDQRVVKFIVQGQQGPESVYAYAFYRDKEHIAVAPPLKTGLLGGSELLHFRARQLAMRHIGKRCAEKYNPVVLPNTDGNGYLVYALAATMKPGIMMVGGHYRFTVSADGNKILQADELFRSCLTVNLDASMLGKPQKGAEVTREAVIVVDEASPTPLETHVFLSLLHKRTVAVTTGPGTVWLVSLGKIRRLRGN